MTIRGRSKPNALALPDLPLPCSNSLCPLRVWGASGDIGSKYQKM